MEKKSWQRPKIYIDYCNISPTGNITELNEVNCTEGKLVIDQIGISQKNRNKNSNLGWEMRREGQIKKKKRKSATRKIAK